jgi:hypothetical protein
MRHAFDTIPPRELVNMYVDVEDLPPSQRAAKLWEAYGDATIDVMGQGATALASLWLSAWQTADVAPRQHRARHRRATRDRAHPPQSLLPAVIHARQDRGAARRVGLPGPRGSMEWSGSTRRAARSPGGRRHELQSTVASWDSLAFQGHRRLTIEVRALSAVSSQGRDRVPSHAHSPTKCQWADRRRHGASSRTSRRCRCREWRGPWPRKSHWLPWRA